MTRPRATSPTSRASCDPGCRLELDRGPSNSPCEISLDARRRLDTVTNAYVRSLEVILLPMPGPILISAEKPAAGVDAISSTLAPTRQ